LLIHKIDPSGNITMLKEIFFDLPFPRSAVWSVFSKTDWLNRSVGLPAVSYRFEPLPEGGSAVFASARAAGVQLHWRELPFEWTEPEFYVVRREFSSGPLQEAVAGVDFLELPDGGTRLRFYSDLTPRNVFGHWLVKAVILPKAARDMAAVAEHVKHFLQGVESQPFPRLPVSSVNEAILLERTKALQKTDCDPAIVERLVDWLHTVPDVELTHIRPKVMARAWGTDTWATLRVLLFGADAGLLQFRWEVLCPNCRSTRTQLTTNLADLSSNSHCDVCQIRFDAEFDKSVELKFTVHPSIREVPDQTFCLAGPGGKPHIVSQLLLQPNETRDWKCPMDGTGLRLRSPQVQRNWLSEDLMGRGPGQFECRPDNFYFSSAEKMDSWKIFNPNPFPLQVILERVAWSDDILTAASVTNWQVFRDLFAAQVVSPNEQIMVGEQAVLFTDLRGSTAMYRALGDAQAYRYVRDHFSVLSDAVQKHHGGIVKTIGDAVMAVFSNCSDAFAAAEAMFAGIAEANHKSSDRHQLILKAGLHGGPCLAVNANDRLDYFGTTVNLTARLTDKSRGGELVLSDEIARRDEFRERFAKQLAEAEFHQYVPRGFTEPVDIWLVPMSRVSSTDLKPLSQDHPLMTSPV
jgi:adenylate cyclase